MSTRTATLAAQLGYSSDARLLIVNCDDLGLCHASNVAVYDALRQGAATSASLMIPCPWAPDAAAGYQARDVGVHLTLNAEHPPYRWGPITAASSLLDPDGCLPPSPQEIWRNAHLHDVKAEMSAQIQTALNWGFDVTHLDFAPGHAGRGAPILRNLSRYGRPVRPAHALSGSATERLLGFPFRQLAASRGVVFPDHLLYVPGIGSRAAIERTLVDLRPGVTEVYLHPAIDTPELRAFDRNWAARADDYKLISGARLVELAHRAGASLIGYRELRELQRHH
jgi:predicted glycoside hydrolase/deacetylase ChbG (UPF0249 family)